MLRITLLVLVAAAAALAPATAGAADCTAPAKVQRERSGTVLRTTVVACGRTVTHATLRPASGQVVLAAASNGTAVAWTELVRGRRQAALRARVVDAASGRRLRTVALGTRRARSLPTAQLVLSSHRDVAARVGDRVTIAPAKGERVVRAGSSDLRLEDDRTVTWQASELQVHDLPRPATPGRCPARTGFTTTAANDRVMVGERQYEPDEVYDTVIRACDVAKGVDHVLWTGHNWLDGGDTLATIGIHGTKVVMTNRSSGDKYDSSCGTLTVRVRDASGTAPEDWKVPCEMGAASALQPGVRLVVTPGLAVAWISSVTSQGSEVASAGPKGFRILDPVNDLPVTDLVADGETIRWKRDGVDRSAAL